MVLDQRYTQKSVSFDNTLKNRILVCQAGALTRLNVIRNNAVRAIFKKKKEFGNEPLRLLAEVMKLEDRMRDLKKRY
jgi:hypothetical protein